MVDTREIVTELHNQRERLVSQYPEFAELSVPPGETHPNVWDGAELDLDGTGEGWSYWEAITRDSGDVVVVRSGTAVDGDDSDEITSEGPMMSYWYALYRVPDPVSLARDLAGLPLCVVNVEGTDGLALTGGGMDLTWEIAEAFMIAGYLPPADHLDLPRMAGRGESEADRRVMAAVHVAALTKTLQALRDVLTVEGMYAAN